MTHTIVLMQTGAGQATRTFLDYNTTAEAIDGLCGIFERQLKDMNPGAKNITYDISELYKFMDALPDLSALVFDEAIGAYLPFDRQWIKQKAYARLSKLAGL
eukprot:TRINITY_DN1095_c2_g1_i1.p5 TRINITY_DN1095_c2_g1~~TRINITY_DN1095_c2_g1_i1.p5  ORF type:complete len:102 (+),score=7.73 TRINITY_DN1095_c2_g1_i1:536-841(+)